MLKQLEHDGTGTGGNEQVRAQEQQLVRTLQEPLPPYSFDGGPNKVTTPSFSPSIPLDQDVRALLEAIARGEQEDVITEIIK